MLCCMPTSFSQPAFFLVNPACLQENNAGLERQVRHLQQQLQVHQQLQAALQLHTQQHQQQPFPHTLVDTALEAAAALVSSDGS